MGNSLGCNSSLTKVCLGVTDLRYDPSVSNLLIDQDSLWTKYTGLWGLSSHTYTFVADGEPPLPRPPTFYDPTKGGGWPYRRDAFTSFRAVSIEGTRFKSQGFFFYEPAPAEFCNQA